MIIINLGKLFTNHEIISYHGIRQNYLKDGPQPHIKLSGFVWCPASWMDVGKNTHVCSGFFFKHWTAKPHVSLFSVPLLRMPTHVTLFWAIVFFLEKSFQTDVSLGIWRLQTYSDHSTKTKCACANTFHIAFQSTVIFAYFCAKSVLSVFLLLEELYFSHVFLTLKCFR